MYWLVLAMVVLSAGAREDFTWHSIDGTSTEPGLCVDIPANNSLCRDIGYRRMRIPNFLGHETLEEIGHQTASWLPFLNLQCHPDSRLFLCSLFCPVCLERPILPCRALCTVVRKGCEGRMQVYGFPWPDMFNCNRFPKDNDMCIAPLTSIYPPKNHDDCAVCNQVETLENILDHYCRAEIAIKTKIRHMTAQKFTMKKSILLKGKFPKLKEPNIQLQITEKCCDLGSGHQRYLIMGTSDGGIIKPSFIMLWKVKKSKIFKRAVRMFNKFNCSDTNAISKSLMAHSNCQKKAQNSERKGKRKAKDWIVASKQHQAT